MSPETTFGRSEKKGEEEKQVSYTQYYKEKYGETINDCN